MSDLFDEALHDRKYERNFRAFKKSLPAVVVITVFVACIMLLVEWYNDNQLKHHAEVGDNFTDLVLSNPHEKPELLSQSLDYFIQNTHNNQVQLAEIKYVANLIAIGKIDQALSKLDQIVANKEYLDITVAYARLIALQLFLNMPELSAQQQTKSDNYMEYFANEEQPFYMTATLLKAFHYKKYDKPELAKLYANKILKMKNASDILMEQAKALLSQI